MVPLIDIMLVLVIIFIVTAPLMTHAVRIDLPKASSALNTQKPESITISIDKQGEMFWDKESVSWAIVQERFAGFSNQNNTIELHIRADESVAYRHVVSVMTEASKNGITKIGFITDPKVTR
jgi:biopolymer transport protein ExbD